jgi:hypothetical protein
LLFFLILFFASANKSFPQDENNNTTSTDIIDSLDNEEDILDSTNNNADEKIYDNLSNDGDWIQIPKKDIVQEAVAGVNEEDIDIPSTEVIYIWRPRVADNYWNPYSNGSWVFTDEGWVWASNYDWGWATYHYGRWWWSDDYGWVWLPGNVWAPNWVFWRYDEDFVGWHPMGPRFYWRNRFGRTVSNNIFVTKTQNWVFTKNENFTKTINNNTIVNRNMNKEILNNTQNITVVNNYNNNIKYKGPDVNKISKSTVQEITPRTINHTQDMSKPKVTDKNVTLYKKNTDSNSKTDNNKNNETNKNVNKNKDNSNKTVKPKTFIKASDIKNNNKKNQNKK